MSSQVPGVQVLIEACALLEREGYADAVVSRAGVGEGVGRIRQTVSHWSVPRSMLRVALVGEFNAGKSTVTNALVGRAVAPTDVFRCTTATTVFVPDTEEFASVRYRDGRTARLAVADYWAAVRDAGASVRTGEIHMEMPVQVELADTPGLGTVQEQDAILADDAVRQADLLLWVMDPNDMLSALEGAFLRRAEEIGMPIICLINKVDELDDGEPDECRREVMRCTGLDGASVLGVSAADHMRTRSDPGMLQLEGVISKQAALVKETRARAHEAHYREMVEETSRALDRVSEIAQADLAWCDGERAVFVEQAGLVKRDVRERVHSMLREAVHGQLHANVGRLGQSDAADPEVRSQIILSICEGALRQAAGDVAGFVDSEARRTWSTFYTDRISDLQEQLARLAADGMADRASRGFLEGSVREAAQRRDAVDESFRWGTSLVLMIATAVFTAATAHISIPLAVIAGAMGGVPWESLLRSAESGSSSGLDDAINVISESVAGHMERHIVRAAADDYLDQVAAQAHSRLVESRLGADAEQVALFAADVRAAQVQTGSGPDQVGTVGTGLAP